MGIKEKYLAENILKRKLAETPMEFREINIMDKMESSLIVPSAVQGYSLGVQYVRDWLLDRTDPDRTYFKTVFINGRHIMQDYMKYSSLTMLKREKPAVAITPQPDMDWDRNTIDSYIGGKDMLVRNINYQQSFFRDYKNNIFLTMAAREQAIEFNIRFRVETRAQQIDLVRRIEMDCRVGYTHKNFVSADFHIPYELMVNIAKHAGFEVDEKDNIIDVVSFLSYLNKNSTFPITYKLRAINGKREFFLRASNVYTHIDTMDKLTYDDGERQGQLDNDFNIEMALHFKMWVPAYFVYTSAKPIYKIIPCQESEGIGLCSVKVLDIPETNREGWHKYFVTDYELDKEEVDNKKAIIDMRGLFTGKDMRNVILEHLNMNISPSRFIDIHLYDFHEAARIEVDWKNMTMVISNIVNISTLKFVIYLDLEYYNDHMITMKNIERTRIS